MADGSSYDVITETGMETVSTRWGIVENDDGRILIKPVADHEPGFADKWDAVEEAIRLQLEKHS